QRWRASPTRPHVACDGGHAGRWRAVESNAEVSGSPGAQRPSTRRDGAPTTGHTLPRRRPVADPLPEGPTMTTPRALVALTLAALGVGGCRSGNDSSGGARPTTTTLAADPASSAHARQALFTAADLGAGWSQYQAAKPDQPLGDQCGEVKSTFSHVPGGTFQ